MIKSWVKSYLVHYLFGHQDNHVPKVVLEEEARVDHVRICLARPGCLDFPSEVVPFSKLRLDDFPRGRPSSLDDESLVREPAGTRGSHTISVSFLTSSDSVRRWYRRRPSFLIFVPFAKWRLSNVRNLNDWYVFEKKTFYWFFLPFD